MKTYDYIVEAMSMDEVDETLAEFKDKLKYEYDNPKIKPMVNGWEESPHYFQDIGRFDRDEFDRMYDGETIKKGDNEFYLMKESKRPRRRGRRLQEKFGEAPGWLAKFLAETKPGKVDRDEYKQPRRGNAKYSAFDSLMSGDLRPSEIKVKSSGPFVDNPIPGACYLFDNGQVWCVGLNDDMKAQFDDKKRPFSNLPKRELHRHVKDSVLMDLPTMSSDASFRDNSVSSIRNARKEAREGSVERYNSDYETFDKSGFHVVNLKYRLKKKYPEMFENKKIKQLYEYIDKINDLKYVIAKKLSNSIINIETKGSNKRNKKLDGYKYALEYLLKAVYYANDALEDIEEYGYTPGEGVDLFIERSIDELVSYVQSAQREMKEAGSVNESYRRRKLRESRISNKTQQEVGVGDTVHINQVVGYPQLTDKEGIVKEIDQDDGQVYGTWGDTGLLFSDDWYILTNDTDNMKKPYKKHYGRKLKQMKYR